MEINNDTSNSKLILAFVGMPGAGKSEATKYISTKDIPFIRFGDLTEEEIRRAGLTINPENERIFREKIRHEKGMDAFAKASKPKIDGLLEKHQCIVIDGLYSWEEYTYLKEFYPYLLLVHVYAEPAIRYARLSKRKVRPISLKDSRKRDVREIEQLNKGGPIAIADYCILNNLNGLSEFYKKLDGILSKYKLG